MNHPATLDNNAREQHLQNITTMLQQIQNATNLNDDQLQQITKQHQNNTLVMQILCDELDRQEALKNKNLTAATALKTSALWYAQNNIAIFPLKPNAKTPATHDGFKSATTNINQINQWWDANSNYNIGIATGKINGFDVWDIDGNVGYMSWLLLDAELGTGPGDTIFGKALTPRGTHIYVNLNTQNDRGNRAGVIEGIDLRGTGGYVVAPPSRIDNKMYSWQNPINIEQVRSWA